MFSDAKRLLLHYPPTADVHPIPIWTKSSARVQPISIGCKAPRFLKSLSGNLADFRPPKGIQFGRGPRVSVGRCRRFAQDFCKRFSGMIKRKLHLLFCKQRRRKHEAHDNSINLCVRALQYVRACKTVRHKPSVRTYDLHRGIPLGRSGFLHPNYGNPDGATSVSAGGLMWNGRSASEWGGG